MLVYKIPREPTAGRVYIWRKLRQLGAVLLQDAVWVLPANPRTQEQFQWLSTRLRPRPGRCHPPMSHLPEDRDANKTNEQQGQRVGFRHDHDSVGETQE